MGRDILHFVRSHRVLDIPVSAPFKVIIGSSSAPEILLFNRFHAKWEQIDKEWFEDTSTDALAEESV